MATDSERQKRGLGISAVEVAAGALAAVVSAIFGSSLGVAGTVVGAALGSVIITVGTSVFTRSLERGRERARRAVTAAHPVGPARPAARRGQPPTPPASPAGSTPAGSTPSGSGSTPTRAPHQPTARPANRPQAGPAARPAPSRRVGESRVWVRTGEQPRIVPGPQSPGGTEAGTPEHAARSHPARSGQLPVTSTPAVPAGQEASTTFLHTTGPPGTVRVDVGELRVGQPGRDRRWWAPRAGSRLRWRTVLPAVLVLTALGIGAVTAIEAGLGSSLWGGPPTTAEIVTAGAVQPRGPHSTHRGTESGSPVQPSQESAQPTSPPTTAGTPTGTPSSTGPAPTTQPAPPTRQAQPSVQPTYPAPRAPAQAPPTGAQPTG